MFWSRLWPDLFFYQDYQSGTWAHLWSVGVEEKFYLLLPVCLVAMIQKRAQPNPFARLPWFCAVIGCCAIAMRACYFYRLSPFDFYRHFTPFHLRCDSLAFGVLLAYWNEFDADKIDRLLQGRRHKLLAASTLCLIPALVLNWDGAFAYIFGLTLRYLGYGGILIYALGKPVGNGLFVKILSRVGRDSYSIYLWHLFAGLVTLAIARDSLHWKMPAVFGSYIAFSMLLGIGSAYLIERPALKLREMLFSDKRHSVPFEGSPRQRIVVEQLSGPA